MRIAATLTLLALAGCTQTWRPAPLPMGPCQVTEEARMRFLGTDYKPTMRDELQYRTNSRVARVLRPDDAATMDVREDRLNVMLTEDGHIDALKCG